MRAASGDADRTKKPTSFEQGGREGEKLRAVHDMPYRGAQHEFNAVPP